MSNSINDSKIYINVNEDRQIQPPVMGQMILPLEEAIGHLQALREEENFHSYEVDK